MLFWDYASELRNTRKRPSIRVPLRPISFPKDFAFAFCFVSEYISTLEFQFNIAKPIIKTSAKISIHQLSNVSLEEVLVQLTEPCLTWESGIDSGESVWSFEFEVLPAPFSSVSVGFLSACEEVRI